MRPFDRSSPSRRSLYALVFCGLMILMGAGRAVWPGGQENLSIRATAQDESGEAHSPVRDAPTTLRIERLGADGTHDAAFDWKSATVVAVSHKDGDAFALTDVTAIERDEAGDETMASRERLAVVDGGALMLRDAVLSEGSADQIDGVEHVMFERTIPGWCALIAPLVAILLAITTRQVLFSLSAGIFAGCLAIAGGPWSGFEHAVTQIVPEALVDGDRVRIVVFSCMLGAVVAMVARMGGTKAIVEAVSNWGKSRRVTQLTTWVSGMLIFFDDYANALLVGNTMRPITDRYRISREKLAFLVDATSAPVACLLLVSTWIVAQLDYIKKGLESPRNREALGLDSIDPYSMWLASWPYNFYPLFALAFGLFICLSGRDFGPMLKAERRALREGKLIRDGAIPLSSPEMEDLKPVDESRLRWWNAAIPIGTVVVGVLVMIWVTGTRKLGTTDATLQQIFGNANSYDALLVAAFGGAVVAVALALGQRLMSLGQTMQVVGDGIKSMIPAILVLVLAWTLQDVCKDLQTSNWLLHHTSLSRSWLPAIIFLLAAGMGFATGTSWGTMGLLIPLTLDYSVGLSINAGVGVADTYALTAATIGSVLAGAVFGDHCSPISDTTIMSSMACGSDHIDHVRTQMPYALVCAGIALVCGYIPAGFGVSPWLLLPFGFAAGAGVIYFFGRRVDDITPAAGSN